MSNSTGLILHADDFGFDAPTSEGILKLLSMGRISGTGCMVTCPAFHDYACDLKVMAGNIDIGMHLTLTEEARLTDASPSPSQKDLLLSAISGQLDKKRLYDEIGAQLSHFQSTFGFLPNYVDGHHHVHQYPVISDILLEILGIKYEAFGQKMPFIRAGHAPLTRILKRGVNPAKAICIGMMGKSFRRKLKSLPTNFDFTGIYNFCAKTSFADMVPRFLIEVEEGTLMLCHPGMPISSRASGVYDMRRAEEFNYLASNAFRDVLASRNLRLRRALL